MQLREIQQKLYLESKNKLNFYILKVQKIVFTKNKIMKTKSILKFLFIALVTTYLGSCTKEKGAEPLFNLTPTERENFRKKELSDALKSSQYGWKLVYFTDSTQLGGFTHLFKFKDNKNVEMASDFNENTIVPETSEYDLQLGSTVLLVFTTKNKIHLLSDSANAPTGNLRGQGYKGDFQFLYYGQDNGEIVFKTNRENRIIRFVKAIESDWADLAKNRIMRKNLIGPLYRSLEIKQGNANLIFDFNYGRESRFAVGSSIEPGSNDGFGIGVAYTSTGIIMNPPLAIGDQNLAVFTYLATGDFVATGTNDLSVTIKSLTKPLFLTDDYKILLPGNPNNVYAHIYNLTKGSPTNSALFESLLEETEATLPAGQIMTRIQPWFNNASGSNYIEYRFANASAPNVAVRRLYHFFTVTENATAKTITLNPLAWKSSNLNSAPAIPAPAFLKGLDDQLMNPEGLYFKLEASGFYTLTSVSNPFRITMYSFQ
jgi:Domain of unknown function (DUF4302)